jgi:RNA polymerase-binding transcription factor DksA
MSIDAEKYKKEIASELAELNGELKALGIHNPEVKTDWIATPAGPVTGHADLNEAADEVEDWDERRATMAVLETRYNNLKRALQKIEEGKYGICEIGGEQIEEARLDANPAARTCKKHLDSELP